MEGQSEVVLCRPFGGMGDRTQRVTEVRIEGGPPQILNAGVPTPPDHIVREGGTSHNSVYNGVAVAESSLYSSMQVPGLPVAGAEEWKRDASWVVDRFMARTMNEDIRLGVVLAPCSVLSGVRQKSDWLCFGNMFLLLTTLLHV